MIAYAPLIADSAKLVLQGWRHAPGDCFFVGKQDSDSLQEHTEINLVPVIADSSSVSLTAGYHRRTEGATINVLPLLHVPDTHLHCIAVEYLHLHVIDVL